MVWTRIYMIVLDVCRFAWNEMCYLVLNVKSSVRFASDKDERPIRFDKHNTTQRAFQRKFQREYEQAAIWFSLIPRDRQWPTDLNELATATKERTISPTQRFFYYGNLRN